MLKDSHVNSDLWKLARHPQGLVRSAKGNVELWANLLVISWAMAFMLWQGDLPTILCHATLISRRRWPMEPH